MISHGDWTSPELASIENAILPRLWTCVQGGDLDLQTPILGVLKTLILKQHAGREQLTSPILGSSTRAHARTRSNVSIRTEPQTPQADNAYLLQTILAGISVSSNRSILADWLDFVLSISTGLSGNVAPILYPISDALCEQIWARLQDTETESSHHDPGGEAEIPLLLQAAELIVRGILPNSVSGDTPAPASGFSEPVGLFGYVSTVLSGDGNATRAMRDAVSRFEAESQEDID